MPPRLSIRSRELRSLTKEPYVCSACLSNAVYRSILPRPSPPRRSQTTPARDIRERRVSVNTYRERNRWSVARYPVRRASNGSLASTTAINAPSAIPPAHRQLYQQLLLLQDQASSYVDLSRLQLAMRSLESESPIVRIALLGLGSSGALAARKLARALLADALAEEEAWEQEIVDTLQDGRSLLLRYGDDEQPAQSNPLVRTMHVPSPYLRRYNLEILVTSLNAGSTSEPMTDYAALEEAVLVPPLTTPNSAQGRVGFVRYPVHKAVVVANGVSGAVEYGRFPEDFADGDLVNAALNIPLRNPESAATTAGYAGAKAVDVELAQEALNLFRLSNANGAEFSDKWQRSRLSGLSDWMTGNTMESSDAILSPAVQNLVHSVLETASTSVSVSEDAAQALVEASTVPDSKRSTLLAGISEWSADAHRDLQSNLDTAFHISRAWRRTTWWRLFWRIDDVTVSASDVLRNSWLTQAEQSLAFLSGCIYDSGLATLSELAGPSPIPLDKQLRDEMDEYENEGSQNTTTVAELTQLPSMLQHFRQESGIDVLRNPPWPQSINLSRQYMLHTLVPELHRNAQVLLLTTVTTIGGSTALGAWFFAATAGHGLYEAGAIVAFGLVWSLRYLQRSWGKKREAFAEAVREEARRVVGEVDARLRSIVNQGGRPNVRPEDEGEWDRARQALRRARVELEKLSAVER